MLVYFQNQPRRGTIDYWVDSAWPDQKIQKFVRQEGCEVRIRGGTGVTLSGQILFEELLRFWRLQGSQQRIREPSRQESQKKVMFIYWIWRRRPTLTFQWELFEIVKFIEMYGGNPEEGGNERYGGLRQQTIQSNPVIPGAKHRSDSSDLSDMQKNFIALREEIHKLTA